MVKRLGYASALILTGILAASPVGALKDFSAKGPNKDPGSAISLYGSPHAVDNTPLNDLRIPRPGRGSQPVSTVPEPAGWLLMLVGFGLLGAMNRRSSPQPLRNELGL